MNDRLFAAAEKGKDIDIQEIANDTGFDRRELAGSLKYEPYHRHLLVDIRDGMKLGIIGTPSYLIDGNIYEGVIPAEVLIPVIEK